MSSNQPYVTGPGGSGVTGGFGDGGYGVTGGYGAPGGGYGAPGGWAYGDGGYGAPGGWAFGDGGDLGPRTRHPLLRPPHFAGADRNRGRYLAGVCAGLAAHLEISPLAVRLVMGVGSLLVAPAILYLWLWIFVPSGNPYLASPLPPAQARLARRPAPTSPPPATPTSLAAAQTAEPGHAAPPVGAEKSRFGWRDSADPAGRAMQGILVALGLLAVAALLWWQGPRALVQARWVLPILLVVGGLSAIWWQIPPLLGERRTNASGEVSSKLGTWLLAALGAGLVIVGMVLLVGTADSPVQTLQSIMAALAALAVLVVALFPLWRRLTGQLAATRVEEARQAERADIAAHLHDSVLQTLTLIRSRADDPQQVAHLARAQERQLRSWLYADRAASGTSLAQELRNQAAQIEDLHGVDIEVICVGDALPGPWSEPLVAATGEALSNAVRHAQAPYTLYFEATARSVQVFVRDRGPGFDLQDIPADRHGVRGSIIERLQRHGGRATIHRRATGTEVEMEVPRPEAAKEGRL